MHLDWTILWREHILQELCWKVNTFCYYFIVWDNTFCYNFTVSDNTSCYSFIVGKNASCYNYTVQRIHLARTMLWRELILQELCWKVNTFCYYFIVWDNTFYYNLTVSDKTSCYSFIVGENTSCWNYTVKRTHLAITTLYMGTHFSNSYCMR